MIEEDGRRPNITRDYLKARTACQVVEHRYGLCRTAPADRTAAPRPSRAELERAQRAGLQEPPRVALRRQVAAAAAASDSEEAFFADLRERGLAVRLRFSVRTPGEVTGYAVAVPEYTNSVGEPVCFSGWQVISSELAADPAIQRLMNEAKNTGDAGQTARRDAATAIERAAAQAPAFAERLRAVLPAEGGAPDGPAGAPAGHTRSGDVNIGDNTSGRIRVNTGNKIINKVRADPAGAFGVLIVVVAVLAAGVFGYNKVFNGPTNGPEALAGSWHASDGSGTKTFNPSGACGGFYYNNGKPLDIGGPTSCMIDSSPGADGRYTLAVKQPPNEDTYKVEFDTAGHAIVYTDGGEKLYEMSRS